MNLALKRSVLRSSARSFATARENFSKSLASGPGLDDFITDDDSVLLGNTSQYVKFFSVVCR